mmetsp:Transcript_26011/g.4459  ORF Transcript_26011/g.4459 Transcript_26011/m.4459 type:complete len:82 (-) Transcript_26011:184-429(-)
MAELIERDVNNVVYRAESLVPPTIDANAVFDIQVCPNSANNNCSNDLLYLGVSNGSYTLTYDYTLVGTTTNNIPRGGAMVI